MVSSLWSSLKHDKKKNNPWQYTVGPFFHIFTKMKLVHVVVKLAEEKSAFNAGGSFRTKARAIVGTNFQPIGASEKCEGCKNLKEFCLKLHEIAEQSPIVK